MSPCGGEGIRPEIDGVMKFGNAKILRKILKPGRRALAVVPARTIIQVLAHGCGENTNMGSIRC